MFPEQRYLAFFGAAAVVVAAVFFAAVFLAAVFAVVF